MIIGMGVDITEVGRIQAAIERHGEPFLRRLYTEKERSYLALAGEAARIAARLGVQHIALSITHTETQALAQVIFES